MKNELLAEIKRLEDLIKEKDIKIEDLELEIHELKQGKKSDWENYWDE